MTKARMSQAEWRESIERVGIVAGSVIRRDGKYLMVEENKDEVRGLWNLPAGYVDKGETIEDGAVREAKEETGFDVELEREIGVYHESSIRPVKHAYLAHLVGGELKAQEGEIQQVKWLSFDEITKLNDKGKIRAEWVWDVIQKVERNEV